jgi:hypothetical protein
MELHAAALTPEDGLGESDKLRCLSYRRLQILSADIEEAIVRLIFEVDQPPKGGRCCLPARLNLPQKILGFMVTLPARPTTQSLAAGGVRGSDSSQHGERCRDAQVVGVLLASGQLCNLLKLPGVVEAPLGIGLRA